MNSLRCELCRKTFRTETGRQWHLKHVHGQPGVTVAQLELPPGAVIGEPWEEPCPFRGHDHEAEAFYVAQPSVVRYCEDHLVICSLEAYLADRQRVGAKRQPSTP